MPSYVSVTCLLENDNNQEQEIYFLTNVHRKMQKAGYSVFFGSYDKDGLHGECNR